jgi:hypothetical protein
MGGEVKLTRAELERWFMDMESKREPLRERDVEALSRDLGVDVSVTKKALRGDADARERLRASLSRGDETPVGAPLPQPPSLVKRAGTSHWAGETRPKLPTGSELDWRGEAARLWPLAALKES